MLLKERIARELERIREENGGFLKQEDVVEFARDPSTALHGRFTWDDTEAAQKWRLYQAGQIIRLVVNVIEDEAPPVRAFVSLTMDRIRHGPGYRAIQDVLQDEGMREQLLADAIADLTTLRVKYKALTQLSRVWNAIDEVALKSAPLQEQTAA
ncbi:MAG: hypothetical protein M3O26_15635 [Pseudomonadota bacterium]|nr:hypothetical protein [Pseudomonadota bacterium]